MNRMIMLGVTLIAIALAGSAQAAEHRLGGGVNYWITIDDIDGDDFDEDGLGYLVSYQYVPGILTLELDLEFLPDRFGETALAPQAYLLLGRGIYAGVGIGINAVDGSFADEPFFALRAGFNLELLPGLYADLNANYRFNDSAEIKDKETDIDTDTIFFGAALRFAF
jgi:hypothetical protein